MPALAPVLSLVLQAASVNPAQVPATGRQEALITLTEPAAIHLSAKSGPGTSCEVVDRVRGPFARSGSAGGSNCELDLLLDAGEYKVRLSSPDRGKGTVQLSAAVFRELNTQSQRLVDGANVLTRLKPGEQASWWVHLDKRGTPYLRIAGRNAGDVRVWRNGEWLESNHARQGTITVLPGQTMHEWWLDRTMEAGDYRVTVYGRDPVPVTNGSKDDSLTVSMGFAKGPPSRAVAFTVPPSGLFLVEAEREWLAALLTLDAPPSVGVELVSYAFNDGSGLPYPQTCRIKEKALVPDCAAWASGGKATRVLLGVRGAPGTKGQLEWHRAASWSGGWWKYGGAYGSPTTRIPFTPGGTGSFLVGVHDLPTDMDAPPLGCQLELVPKRGDPKVLGRSMMTLGDGEKLERAFNYDGGEVVWFRLTRADRYRILTSGGRKSRCELYKLKDDGTLERLTKTKPDAQACDERLALSPGDYQLQLFGGNPGIEQLLVREDSNRTLKDAPSLGGCLLPHMELSALQNYALTLTRTGRLVARGLVLQRTPLNVTTPFHVTLDANQTLPLELTAGPAFEVTSTSGTFTCGLSNLSAGAASGRCRVGALTKGDTLTLKNPGTTPVQLTLAQPQPPPPPVQPPHWSPNPQPLTRIAPETPLYQDFERSQTHSVVFDVDKPGLYHATTEGLLSTRCTLRTPVVESVGANARGGRGRNCLVAMYLQPGRHMFTATTEGQSRGRGALLLTRQPPVLKETLTADGEAFFRVPEGQLVQQKLTVKSAGHYLVGTTAQGASLSCRLDDPDGWPLETVPSSCSSTRTLEAGTWLWTQLPLTVESMRRSKLERVKPPVVLTGNRLHPVEFFTWYDAELGKDGKDELRFSLEGESELDVVLTNGMQGRIFRLEADKKPKPVELIPPQGLPADSYEGGSEGGGDEGGSEVERGYEGDGDEGDGDGEYEGEPEYERAPPTSLSSAMAQARALPRGPQGVKVTLPAGKYALVTEHSRGDVNISYRVYLGSATFLPGMARDVPVPTTMLLYVPRDGTLRLATSGDADVRCRLFDKAGKLMFEGDSNGADWNCALAEPVARGRYTLVLESETQLAGSSRVASSLAPVQDLGALTGGHTVTLAESVATLSIPVAEKDAVQEIFVSGANTPFSCAVEDEQGRIVETQRRVKTCAVLLRPKLGKYRLRLWTTDGAAAVTTRFTSRPVVAGKGDIGPSQATRVAVPRAGRYETARQVFCIGGDEAGLLRPCGPMTSLERGEAVLATFGTRPLPVPMRELTVPAAQLEGTFSLSQRPFLHVVTAPAGDALVLVEAQVQHGEHAPPACAFDGAGTVHQRRDSSCFAATGVTRDATVRLWAPTDDTVAARVKGRAVTLPKDGTPLVNGRAVQRFKEVTRLSLPSNAATRVEVTLPGDGWAVLLDDKGAALDLCAPTGSLSACTLTGQGGSVVVATRRGKAETLAVTLERPPRRVAFTGLYEALESTEGSLLLEVPPAPGERTLNVEGARHCVLALDDGRRFAGCRGAMPGHVAGELQVDHGTGALRVMLHTPGRDKWARLGVELPRTTGPALSPALAVTATGAVFDRTLTLAADAVVRVKASAGVCGLVRGSDLLSVDGDGAGCELSRVLSPGTYRLLVRPFGGQAPGGEVHWTQEPVTALGEGVGGEVWLNPGESRLFRFKTKLKAPVGLGMQSPSELLECTLYNDGYQQLGQGCQQYLPLSRGTYLVAVRNPAREGAKPLPVKPVLLGLKSDSSLVPREYLEAFFRRIGDQP